MPVFVNLGLAKSLSKKQKYRFLKTKIKIKNILNYYNIDTFFNFCLFQEITFIMFNIAIYI